MKINKITVSVILIFLLSYSCATKPIPKNIAGTQNNINPNPTPITSSYNPYNNPSPVVSNNPNDSYNNLEPTDLPTPTPISTLTPTPTPILTLTPTPTPTLTPTPTPSIITVVSINILPPLLNLKVGDTQDVTALVQLSNGTTTSNVSWSSSDSNIASITSTGRVTAVNVGITTIKASSGNASSFINVTVSPKPTPTPYPYGNEPLGSIGSDKLKAPYNVSVQNGKVYVTDVYTEKKSTWFGLSSTTITYKVVHQFTSTGSYTMSIPILSKENGDLDPLTGLAIDGSGNIWVSSLKVVTLDSNTKKNIYKFTSTGQKIDYFLFPTGTTNCEINDIAVDRINNTLYIADAMIGAVGKYVQGSEGNPNFTGSTPMNPAGVAIDNDGNLFVSNATTGEIMKFSSSGELLLKFNGKGISETGYLFSGIGDLAIDPRNKDIYVLGIVNNNGNDIKLIARYNALGDYITILAQSEIQDPGGISIDNDGTIYVVDKAQKSILKYGKGK